MPSPNDPVLGCPLPIVSLQYLSRSSLHRLAGLPCHLFLSNGLQVVTRDVHQSSLRRLICPAQDHFIFLTVLIISMSSCPLPDPDVGLSILVCDVLLLIYFNYFYFPIGKNSSNNLINTMDWLISSRVINI